MHTAALDDIQLPASIQAELETMRSRTQSVSQEQLSALAVILKSKRKEAIDGRANSGIEEVWMSGEEGYVGIDDANRHEFTNARWAKPTTKEGGLQKENTGTRKGDEIRCTLFVPLTARYVDAGSAKLAEILLPTDDKAFSFEATPNPDLIKSEDDARQLVHQGVPLQRDPTPEELQAQATAASPSAPAAAPVMPGQEPPATAVRPAQAPGVPLTIKDLVDEAVQIATEKAKKAEKRVYDWHIECQYAMHMRKVIFDSCRIGVGVAKGPYPDRRRAMAVEKTEQGFVVKVIEKLAPHTKWIDPWNFFPDPSCGENIHNGSYVWERDFLSERQLRDLKGLPGYINAEIDEALKEGPGSQNLESRNPNDPVKDDRFEVWYYHGALSRKDMQALTSFGNPQDGAHYNPLKGSKDDQKEVYALVTMVNDRPIRAALNPLDSGEFPYDAMPWRRRAGHWAGIGVGEQCSTPQRIVNGATRALIDNAGNSAGPQVVVDRGCVAPADGLSWVIAPWKVWLKNADTNLDDVRKAFHIIEIPSKQADLMAVINYGFRLAEECTNIPLISQGQSGDTTPDTLGATQIQNNNANQLLRNIGASFDEHITEPGVRRYYEYLLLDPDVPNDEKGDYLINARGSAALVERYIQEQFLMQIPALSLNPAFGLDPKRSIAELLKSKKLDPRNVQYSPEEQDKIDQQPPPVPPAVQAAQVRAQTDLQLAQFDQQLEQQRIAMQERLAQSKTDIDRATMQLNLQMLQVKRELAIMDYSNRRGISVEQVKARLAETVMKLRTQKDLALASRPRPAQQVATPATEPPGRAKPGEAFQK